MVLVGVVGGVGWLEARPGYLRVLPPQAQKCQVCHPTRSGMGGLNPFGKAFEETRSLALILDRDSDGDGFTNREELEAGTNPGHPRSYPGARPPVPLWLVIGGGVLGAGGLWIVFRRSS